MFKKSHLGAGGLAVIALLFIAIMLLVSQLPRGMQIDLTADKLYTLSEGTRNIVSNLKEPVNLYFFYSEKSADSRPNVKTYAVRVRELLEELVSLSRGKLSLKVIDPEPFSEEEDRAAELGINPVPIDNLGGRMYFGVAGTNSTNGQEVLPPLDPNLDEQLEYEVAKLIYRLSNTKKPVVGWLSSLPMQGSFDPQSGRPTPPWVVYAQLEQLYTLRTLDNTLTAIDPDIDVLVLVHPKDLPPAALYAIDQYAMRGGHVLAFVDPNAQADHAGMDPQNPMSQFTADRSSHLEPLLASWGVEFKPDQVVADLDLGLVIQMRENEPPTQHIGILGLNEASFAKDTITTNFDKVNLMTAGALKPLAGSKLKFEPLMHTSKQAGLLPAQRFVMMSDPSTLRDGFKPSGEFVLGARISGNASSAYPGGPPAGVTAAKDALKASAKPLNVVVIADSDLLLDLTWVQQTNFFGQIIAQPVAKNGELVWNAIDNLAGSNDLISIRGRATYRRPFERVDAMRRRADAQVSVKQQQLQTELDQTQERLDKLLAAQPAGAEAILSPELEREIKRGRAELLRIRKEQRAVKAGVEADIKSLGRWLKTINILLMPLLVTGAGVLFWLWRRRRRQAMAMLHKGAAS